MKREDKIKIGAIIFMAIALIYGVAMGTNLVSASPYQLNLTTGIITDLNSSNNGTTNFTIYILYYNTTAVNNTYLNITYQNYTCATNSSCNITYNYVYNSTGNWTGNFTGYNKTEEDARFVLVSDYNSYKSGLNYVPRTDFDSLTARVNALNVTTETTEISTGDTVLWALAILGCFTGLLAIFIAWRNSNG